MTTTRTETITTPDGSFAAHVSIPTTGSGPGILVLQEIFGVNSYIEDVCERLAAMGYVALAPDVFWRSEPGFVVEPAEGEHGMNRAFEKMGNYDFSNVGPDLGASLDHLRGLDECSGDAGVMGFCFGGTLSFLAAADLEPTCAVSYYGSGVAANLERADDIACPILFHFGGDDPYLPSEDVAKIEARFAEVDRQSVVVQDGAGHAFDNHTNPNFSNPDAAESAWRVTVAFLGQHLPT